MKVFKNVLLNTLVSNFVTSFVWFALTFWLYLETKSVLATSIVGGSFMLFSALVAMYFGTYVDHHKKKLAMTFSSLISLVCFTAAGVLYAIVPNDHLTQFGMPAFWLFIVLILLGSVAGNLRMIALATTVTLLVPEDKHDKANGMVGTVNGLAFAITSVFSGLAVGLLGMGWTVAVTIAVTLLVLLHLTTIAIPEKDIEPEEGKPKKIDLRGTFRSILAIPALMSLILFATFNNLLGGVFMALLDPYGLNMVSVEAWGIIWGMLSFGFIVGGVTVAKKGLGKNPLRTLLLTNVAMWIIALLFPTYPSIVLLFVGMFAYMCLIPVIEASEQTVIQRIVPFKKQGRVFGFAQTVESASAPVTAFMIGPIAQFVVIPFMVIGSGVHSIGRWFGSGANRGIALIFIVTAILGLLLTMLALMSKAYKQLTTEYEEAPPQPVATQ